MKTKPFPQFADFKQMYGDGLRQLLVFYSKKASEPKAAKILEKLEQQSKELNALGDKVPALELLSSWGATLDELVGDHSYKVEYIDQTGERAVATERLFPGINDESFDESKSSIFYAIHTFQWIKMEKAIRSLDSYELKTDFKALGANYQAAKDKAEVRNSSKTH